MNYRPLAWFLFLSLAIVAGAAWAATTFDANPIRELQGLEHPILVGAAGLLIVLIGLAALRSGGKRAKQAEAKFQNLFESSPDAVVLVDGELRILSANRQTERLVEHAPETLVGKSLEFLIPEKLRSVFQERAGVDATSCELTARRADGSTFPVMVRVQPIHHGEGRAYLCVLRDLTERQQVEESRRKVEESLRETEFKYRSIFEHAAEGIYQVTPEGRFLTANPALARMLGYSSPEELMEKITDIKRQVFVEPAKRSEIRRMSEQSGQARGFEHQAYRKDGSKIWLLGNQRVVRDESDKVLYYEGNFEEITERKRAEEALRESQRALVNLMSNLPGMAYRCRNDRERTIEFASEGAFTLTGFPPAQLVDNRKTAYGHLIHPDDRDLVYNEIQAALTEDRPYQVQYRLQTPAREKIVWEQGRGFRSPVDVLTLEGLVIDISEQVRAQEGMRKSEERFRLLAEHLDGVFWMTDPQMKELHFVNGAFEKIWGRSRASLYKNPRSWLEAVDPEDRPRVQSTLDQSVSKGFNHEYRIHRPDGAVRWIWDRGFPIPDDKGQIYRLAGIATDITERKRLEGELLQAQKMEAVGRLAGGIAHDFNNLLTVINGYSEMVLSDLKRDDPIHSYLAQIHQAGERAASLTSQLLAFSRKQMLIPKIVDLNSLVRSIKDMVHRLIGEDIDFHLKLDDQLAPVEADPGQIQQVLMNLVVNARDAMPRGGEFSITTRNVELSETDSQSIPESRPGSFAVLEVRDTGFGMDTKTKNQIFEPFFTTKEVGKGTGLGLSTVYGIISQSGGFIHVQSAPEQGSTFTIYLPRAKSGPSREQQVPPSDAAVRGQETVLLVEDEDMVRLMSRTLLQKSGYTVLEARNGQEALDVADQHSSVIHLLVTDVIMPGMNGHDLYQKLSQRRTDMKVLFMSGYTDSALLRHGVLNANLTILLKPFAPDVFLGTVRDVLDH